MNNQNVDTGYSNYFKVGLIPLIILFLHKYLENILWPLYMIPGYIIIVIYILPTIGIIILVLSIIKDIKLDNIKMVLVSILAIFILLTPILNNTFRPKSTKIINFNLSIYFDSIFKLNKSNYSNSNNEVYEFELGKNKDYRENY